MMVILGPLMLSMWLISSIGIKLLIGIDWLDAMLIGACVTPTDPILANSIVHGSFAEENIPHHVRLLISAESAANDGLGLAFLFLPLYLKRLGTTGLGWWVVKVLIYQVFLSIVLGAIVGTVCRKLLQNSQERNWIDKESLLAFSIALSLAICGGLSLLGTDDILACYVAGLALSWDHWINTHIAESKIQEVIDILLNFSF